MFTQNALLNCEDYGIFRKTFIADFHTSLTVSDCLRIFKIIFVYVGFCFGFRAMLLPVCNVSSHSFCFCTGSDPTSLLHSASYPAAKPFSLNIFCIYQFITLHSYPHMSSRRQVPLIFPETDLKLGFVC